MAVRCKQGARLQERENQWTSVHLSQAGDQIEKWIAQLAANLHCDKGAIHRNTCLGGDNGHFGGWLPAPADGQ